MSEAVYCICRSIYKKNVFMIACDDCGEWYHGACIDLDEETSKFIDKYFCDFCRIKNPDLQTTYKVNQNKKKRKTPRRQRKRKCYRRVTIPPQHSDPIAADIKTETNSNFDIEAIASGSNNLDDEQLAQILQMDTSKRKAKTIARKNLKMAELKIADLELADKEFSPPTTPPSPPVVVAEKKEFVSKPSSKPAKKRQCYGPGCAEAARESSKYCSDDCGVRLATNRILAILPQRIEQMKRAPSAADEMDNQKLANVRSLMKYYQKQFEFTDFKIVQLLRMVHKSKSSPQDTVILSEDDEDSGSTMDCKLCGMEVAVRSYVRHVEGCFKKQEKRVMLTGSAVDDGEWDIFCNHKMGRQGHCKQLRVLCPHHYRSSSDESGICGFPIEMNLNLNKGKFCGRVKKDCHLHSPSWEESFRAEYDMEKLQILLKLSDLEKEEAEIREAMAQRGNVVALMLHETTVH